MKRVKVKDVGIKLNGDFHFKGEEQIISEAEYLKNKEFVDVLEEIEGTDETLETEERKIEIIVKDENIDLEELKTKLEEYVENYNKVPVENPEPENPGQPDESNEDDEELEQLRERAKELAIKNAHSMKKETLIAKIQEVENAGTGDDQQPNEE